MNLHVQLPARVEAQSTYALLESPRVHVHLYNQPVKVRRMGATTGWTTVDFGLDLGLVLHFNNAVEFERFQQVIAEGPTDG